jgi:hypothetical protein
MIAAMRNIRRTGVAAIVSVAVLCGVSSVGAQSPARPGAALVLEVSGGHVTGIEAFQEVPAGATLTVPAGTKLVFQHYASCRRFTLVGGVVTVRSDGVDFSGGARPTDIRGACPKKLTLKDEGTSAATVMRSAPRTGVSVSTRPDFVLVGPNVGAYVALRVRRGEEIVLEQDLTGGRNVRWPADKPPLATAASYELELVPTRANAKPLVIGFRTVDDAPAADTITLVSVE